MEGSLVPRPDLPYHRAAGRSTPALCPALRVSIDLESKNESRGRFTVRASADSHGRRRRSVGAATSFAASSAHGGLGSIPRPQATSLPRPCSRRGRVVFRIRRRGGPIGNASAKVPAIAAVVAFVAWRLCVAPSVASSPEEVGRRLQRHWRGRRGGPSWSLGYPGVGLGGLRLVAGCAASVPGLKAARMLAAADDEAAFVESAIRSAISAETRDGKSFGEAFVAVQDRVLGPTAEPIQRRRTAAPRCGRGGASSAIPGRVIVSRKASGRRRVRPPNSRHSTPFSRYIGTVESGAV